MDASLIHDAALRISAALHVRSSLQASMAAHLRGASSKCVC